MLGKRYLKIRDQPRELCLANVHSVQETKQVEQGRVFKGFGMKIQMQEIDDQRNLIARAI